MKPHLRASVAAIAISHSNNKAVSSIYDYSEGVYANIEVKCSGDRVVGHDYSSGAIEGNLPDLYHYGVGGHIELKHQKDKHEGFDYSSSSHFEVTVKGTKAELFDYGAAGGWFSYSV